MAPLYVYQERVMADTMQLLTGERETRRCVTSAAGPRAVPRRENAMEPVASTVFARLSKGLTLAATAGITAARRSVAGKTKWARVIIATG